MPNYLLRLSFVGTRYKGWQIQPKVPTIQGELTSALGRMFGEEIKLIGCSRTDAGVHALDYVANFTSSRVIEERKILMGINSMIPKDIAVKRVERVRDSFNARYSVRGKVYLYRILNQECRDPFEHPFSWHIPFPLREQEMRKAVVELSGKRDFKGFAKLEGKKETVVDLSIEMTRKGNLFLIRFRAPFFLRYMVRRLTAAIVWTGLGKLTAEDLRAFLKGRKFPYTAPAKGLFLEKVIL